MSEPELKFRELEKILEGEFRSDTIPAKTNSEA
jgi:hypothetical protein